MKYTPAQVKKSLVALVGFVLTVLATILGVAPGLIPVEYLPHVNVALAVGTIYGVYKVKNADYPTRDQLKTEVDPHAGSTRMRPDAGMVSTRAMALAALVVAGVLLVILLF